VILAGKPSFGSWLSYGLGSENQNLPGYVLLFKVGGLGGSANWSNGFLPAAFQGTRFREVGTPVLDLEPPVELAGVQRSTLDVIRALNEKHRDARPGLLDLGQGHRRDMGACRPHGGNVDPRIAGFLVDLIVAHLPFLPSGRVGRCDARIRRSASLSPKFRSSP
jgi:hypothetical protein